MNLKEAFRFQNKLQSLMEEGKCILGRDQNITNVKSTYLRKKVMAEAEDETMMEQPTTEYSEKITEVAGFLLYLLGEREKLSAAIQKAKMELNMPAGYDGERLGLTASAKSLLPCSAACPIFAAPKRLFPTAVLVIASTMKAIKSPIAAM